MKTVHSWRRRLLVLLAVVVPSVALVALGLRLLVQDARLEETRRSEALDLAVRDLSSSLYSIRQEPPDSLVIMQMRIAGEEPVPPWMGDVDTSADVDGRFARALLRAEQREFSGASYDDVLAGYEAALETASDSSGRSAVLLAMARASRKAGRLTDASRLRSELLSLDPSVVDEFDVPYALYAAVSERAADGHDDRIVRVLNAQAVSGGYMSPPATFMYRTLLDSLSLPRSERVALQAYLDRSIDLVSLTEDYPALHPVLARPGSREAGWLLYADDRWLLTHTDRTPPELLVLDAHGVARVLDETLAFGDRRLHLDRLDSDPDPPNRFLGPGFNNVYATVRRLDPARPAWHGTTAFVILTILLVIVLLSLGAFLLWRDTRREIDIARLRADFIASVSHELKTPLTTIQMYAETLRMRQQDEASREEYLETISHESRRLGRLLKNILNFARMERGDIQYDRAPVDVRVVCSSALAAIQSTVGENNFRITTSCPDEPVLVEGDADALEQSVLNLLSNAMKYSGDSRRVELSVRTDNSGVRISVRDHGAGIEPDEIDRIFEPYYRSRNAGGLRVPGTGLGLSIVRHTVEAHGGRVEVESDPASGSTFTIHLPTT